MNSKTVRCLLEFVFKRFKGEVFNAFFKVIPTFYSCQVDVEFTIVCLACVAADFFPFSGGGEIEQANEKRASEGARLGWAKKLGRSLFCHSFAVFLPFASVWKRKGNGSAATQAIVCFDGIDVIG